MKVIVAGGRDFTDVQRMDQEIKKLCIDGFIPEDATLISGMARGADYTAHTLWKSYGNPIEEYPVTASDWTRLGKGAGIMRNIQMGDIADKLIAFWDGKSPGTKHMINYMRANSKPVHVIHY